MRKVFPVFLVLVLLALMAAPVFAITNGEPDGNGHPNVGAIMLVYPGASYQVCTGTLVSPSVFLTAGHCTGYLEEVIQAGGATLDNVQVSFDADNAYNEGLLPATGIETHPDFRPNPGTGVGVNDIGVLYLNAADTNGITPAILPPAGFLDDLRAQGLLRQGSNGARFVAVGYGILLSWPPPAFSDPEGVRYVSRSEFSNLRQQWLQMSQNQAPGNGNGGTCYGDSGGPNFWVQPDGSEVLVSITSWGDIPCVSTNITQRTDSTSAVEFLADVMD